MDGLLQRLSFRTAGESHGPAVISHLEGIPRGLELDADGINAALKRRQGGAGRGGRQRIEDDAVEFLSGVRRGKTIGSPICMRIANRDHTIDELPEPTRPRPGHIDLAAAYRYGDLDLRGSLERSSARETAGRVAAGAVASQLLGAVGSEVFGFVRSIHQARLDGSMPPPDLAPGPQLDRLRRLRDGSRLYTLSEAQDTAMLSAVQEAGRRRDTVGGEVEVWALDVLPGIGSHLQWSERLDARLAAAVMSIQAFKGVEIGAGFHCAAAMGSEVHDAILPGGRRGLLARSSNRSGGLEGGTTTGAPLVVRGAMKPISTLRQPLDSVDLATGEGAPAGYERSDLCAVSAASVVAEAMVALVVADALLVRVGGETLEEFVARHSDCWERAAGISRGAAQGGGHGSAGGAGGAG